MRGSVPLCDTPVIMRGSFRVPRLYSRISPVFLTSLRNIAEQLIEKGLASVVRHKRDDEDRSPDFDKLVVAEQA